MEVSVGGDPTSTTTTTTCKIFVGGLAWETPTQTLKQYFHQFGDIHEAIVITDRATGKSKGYGFVTFKDPESARRACENPYPVIDGRRANCNIAYLGAHNKRRPPLLQHGMEKVKAAVTSTVDFGQQQQGPQYAFLSTYGYPTFSHSFNHSMNYYNAYGGGGQVLGGQGQRQQPFRFPGAGVYVNYYPFPLSLYTQPQQQQQSGPNQPLKMVVPQQIRRRRQDIRNAAKEGDCLSRIHDAIQSM